MTAHTLIVGGQSDGKPSVEELRVNGFAILKGPFDPAEAETLARAMSQRLNIAADRSESVRRQHDAVYAARNVLEHFPEVIELWRKPRLLQLVAAVLGQQAGLVRALFFDKPPERTWALPWHKDLSIAIRNRELNSTQFSPPRLKAGVPHVEAPLEVLEKMLTLRIHLDDVTEANGPLRVIPGSHRTGKEVRIDSDLQVVPILATRGDVLAMRPLLVHSSPLSHEGTTQHRRILHLEFAASAQLPDGAEWHEFHTVGAV